MPYLAVNLIVFVAFALSATSGSVIPTSRPEVVDPLTEEHIYDTFKFNLVRYYGVSEAFAEQFKENLKRAIVEERKRINNVKVNAVVESVKQERQLPPAEEEEDEDDEVTTPGSTTLGPSPFSIVNGIYGILQGVGTLNPDRVLQSTVNFFPPSQKGTAQALIDSAQGKNPSSWPTTPSTTPTTTIITTSTKDPDDDDDDDDDKPTTKAAPAAVVAAATPAPVAVAVVATQAPVVSAATVKSLPVQQQDDEKDEQTFKLRVGSKVVAGGQRFKV